VADGQWHFVAISFSRCGSPTGLFYVDGATAAFTPRVGSLVNAPPLFIGRRSPALGPNFFTGKIDELMYFKAAYTKAELDSLRLDKCQQKCWM
jgi:Concanavalin A-like lectin/glucanases superfamily